MSSWGFTWTFFFKLHLDFLQGFTIQNSPFDKKVANNLWFLISQTHGPANVPKLVSKHMISITDV